MAFSPFASAVKAVLPVPLPPSSVAARRAAPALISMHAVASRTPRHGAKLVVAVAVDDMRLAIDEYPEGIHSGEWPENFSLLSYVDLRAYLESQIVTSDKIHFLPFGSHLTSWIGSCSRSISWIWCDLFCWFTHR
jgi:hypothetical protein